MKPVAELKKEVVFNQEMNELIDILKKVATTQFQAIFSRWKSLSNEQRFVNLIPTFLENINLKTGRHPLLTNPPTNVLSVIITSDAGFLGGLNTSVIETAFGQKRKKEKVEYTVVGEKGREYMKDKATVPTAPTPREEDESSSADRTTPESFEATVTYEPFLDVVVLGEKGRDYMESTSAEKNTFDFVPGVSDKIGLTEAQRLSNHIFRICLKDKIGKVVVTYPRFISFAQQEVETLNLFEWLNPSLESSPSAPPTDTASTDLEFTYEPFLDKVADYLLRLWLTHKIYDIYWHSKLSEFAARMMHLESSLQELTEMKKQLNLQYFKSKHELTDRTIRDIFGGILTTKHKLKRNQEVSN